MATYNFEKFINKKLLIKLVEDRPILWDKTLELYKDKFAKTEAWREICVILHQGFEFMEQNERQEFGTLVMWKWTQIRDAWLRTLKVKNKYHQHFLFMYKVVDVGETHESMPANEEDDNRAAEESDKINEEDIEIIELSSDDSQSEIHNVDTRRRRTFKRSFNEIDLKTMRFLDERVKQKKIEHEDHHMSFFKAMLPSLALLNEDQTLEFQTGVIKLINDIKKRV